MPRHSDPLEAFSRRIVQIKIVIIDVALLIVFLFFVLRYIGHELGLDDRPRIPEYRPQKYEHRVVAPPEAHFANLAAGKNERGR